MEDRSDRPTGLIIVVLIVVAAAGALYAYHHWAGPHAITRSIDETLDAVVPDAESFERRRSAVDQARGLVDELNARPRYERDGSE